MMDGIPIPAQYRKSDFAVNRHCDGARHHNCDMRLGERIKELRKTKGLSQKRLAVESGLSQTTISDLERGRNAGSSEVAGIARALGITVEDLLSRRTRSIVHAVREPDLFLDDQEALIEAWKLLTPKQRAEQLHHLQELAAANVDLVRQLGHISPNMDRPVSNEHVEKHLPAAPRSASSRVKAKP